MVSIKRARECIGRRVIHTSLDLKGNPIKGVVESVDKRGDIRVVSETDGASLCDPENLTWDDGRLSPEMIEAIRADEDFENGQIGYESTFGTGAGFVYSCALANDNGEDRPLYVVARFMRRVHPINPLADPWLGYAIEEALGWAEP